ncbi:DUF86 domain-containing protein [candidate division TA06 bacterium]|uniref:DUF86 domain-containing protein n=1 Tax=candidate division TA06 bacterium TaxID=2250710 RepID=A0A933ICY8_UNCT6|nr:DUF86 domain-containing protein [candidate division TA06 bacterium]
MSRLKDDKVFLKHILAEAEFIASATAGLNYEALLKDGTLQRAILRSLEIIGEASKQVSPEFKVAHEEIEWKAMAGLRDKLIHAYFGVDWRTVWSVINDKIPPLREAVEALLRE